MARNLWAGLALVLAVTGAPAQVVRPAIDVRHYAIEADVDPQTQSISAKVEVRFVPGEGSLSSAAFELNNALNVATVSNEAGEQIPASRSHRDFLVSLNFPQPLPGGQPATLTFEYDGRLTGKEESPVFGIKFAALNPDSGFLLYPARWFPVSGYAHDAFTADLRITVPTGYRVVSSGHAKAERLPEEKTRYTFQFTQPSFPGSLAVVKDDPVRVAAEGATIDVYFRGERQEMASAYGAETGKLMSWLGGHYGLPPQANMTLVETESGAANGYSAPGVLFLSPRGIGSEVNTRLLSNQLARQWWGALVAPANRGHIWLTNGMARYSEMLYLEHLNGAEAMEAETRDIYIDALTVNDVPVIQAGRLEDYSPEFWAVTASKGAAVMNMLRHVIGENNFRTLVKEFPDKHAWTGVSTADFQKMAEAVSGQNLSWFFLQWIESSGAPEFTVDYTIYRTQQGFRIMGKVAQDLDTFRMPVDLRIETEGNPEDKKVEVVGTSSEFVVDTFGKPRRLALDPENHVLRFDDRVRVAVAIRRGEQFVEIGEFNEALKEYQRALEVNRNSSLAHYRVAEVFLLQNNYQAAANEFREALNGDLEPEWTEVWSRIKLGNIFDITGQRERAVNEYTLAMRTKDNTQGALEEAARYLKEPYERQRPANY